MVSEICREMIEDSPIAYAKIKINKIEENFILDKILDENKAYKKFKENYDLSIEDLIFNKNIDYNYILSKSQKNKKHSLKTYFEKYYDENDDKQTWFNKIKEVAGEMGYAKEVKEFKANPEAYKAHVGDVSTALRVALTARTNTPDMYEIMKILGKERMTKRFNTVKF